MHLSVPGLDKGMHWVGGEVGGRGALNLFCVISPSHWHGPLQHNLVDGLPPKDEHAVVQQPAAALESKFYQSFPPLMPRKKLSGLIFKVFHCPTKSAE